MINAGRAWFILSISASRSFIVNRGRAPLSRAAGLPAGVGPSTGVFRAVPRSGRVGLIDRETLKRPLDCAARVFDTRTRAEFTGEDARNRSRSGDLPGGQP
jgi:thiosulfate/3-mercaptopyruvate sulfurtransferase